MRTNATEGFIRLENSLGIPGASRAFIFEGLLMPSLCAPFENLATISLEVPPLDGSKDEKRSGRKHQQELDGL
jgi:hypothetical protein